MHLLIYPEHLPQPSPHPFPSLSTQLVLLSPSPRDAVLGIVAVLTESCPGRISGWSRRVPGLVGDITEMDGRSIFWDSKELEPAVEQNVTRGRYARKPLAVRLCEQE